MSKNLFEKRNAEELILTELQGEHLVYDKSTDVSHLLQKEHFAVLQLTGEQADEAIAEKVFSEDMLGKSLERVRLIQDQLAEKDLLRAVSDSEPSRRVFLKKALVSAALPAILSVAAAVPAAASSFGSSVFTVSNPAAPVPGGAPNMTIVCIGGGGGGGGLGGGFLSILESGSGSQGQTVTTGPIATGGATINVVVGTGGTGGVDGVNADGGAGGAGGMAGAPGGAAGVAGMNGAATGRGGGGGGASGGMSSVNGVGVANGGSGGGASEGESASGAADGANGADGSAGGAGGAGGSANGGDGGSGGGGNNAARNPGSPGGGGSSGAAARNGLNGQVTVFFCN